TSRTTRPTRTLRSRAPSPPRAGTGSSTACG
ncbi:MAG: hypothetical protein AVDCRST_MAG89-3939, partial [uncultured Gemmatimonadetes bacterium]